MNPSSSTLLDSMQMTQQIQTLIASVEELVKQKLELSQCVSQENSNVPPRQCNQNNNDEEVHSPRNSHKEESSRCSKQSNSRRIEQSNQNNDELEERNGRNEKCLGRKVVQELRWNNQENRFTVHQQGPRMPSPRGLLSSVSIDFYGYGQPKLNILVCEILNRNRPKWLEINRFQCILVSIDFGRFLVFQREGY